MLFNVINSNDICQTTYQRYITPRNTAATPDNVDIFFSLVVYIKQTAWCWTLLTTTHWPLPTHWWTCTTQRCVRRCVTCRTWCVTTLTLLHGVSRTLSGLQHGNGCSSVFTLSCSRLDCSAMCWWVDDSQLGSMISDRRSQTVFVDKSNVDKSNAILR